MKLRKLFAWMMTLAMLFGMIPAAQAQTIWCPDMGWEHDWSTPEYDYGTCDWGFKYCKRCGAGSEVPPQHKWVTQTIEQPDCTEPGWKESLCANCGDEKGDRQEIPALGHNWGSWRWVHGEPPCNSRGAWQIRDCQRCNQQEDRWIEGGAHAFGPWYSTQEPTCMAPGRQEHTCTLCGHTEWTTIPQMDHVFGEWRVIEEPQVGIPGTERRACTYHCGTHEDREIPPLTAETDASLPQATKSIIGNPDNGEYYVPGEDIQFFLSLKNTCGQPIDRGFFIDPLFPDWTHDTLYIPQGETVNTMLRYIVTEEDAARGYVENTFTAQLHVAGEYLTVTSNTVTALCGSADNAAAASCLTVDMTYTNTPANGSFFTPGEVINYLITVTNTGDVPLTNLQVGNSASEAVVPAPSEIAPGQTIQVPYYKLVYEENAKAGGINSYGHAHAFNGDPALPESLVSGRSADVFVPCGKGDGSPSVYYLKIVANAPANGLFFTEGETIKYRLSFGNNTKKDIYNITLNDPMANTRSVAFARRLKAGEFLMGEFEYVVTAADVEDGQIVNTGTSTWATKAEGAQTKTSSNTVVTATGVDQPAEISPDAMLEKYVKNVPANGEYFVPGETIEYAVIFMNTRSHELHDVEVYDPLKGSNEDIIISREPIVEPNGVLYLSFRYVVTEEDAVRGTVVNTASALWLNPETEEWSSCDSNTVTTEVGMPNELGLSFTKTVTSTPANGMYYVPGEEIHFLIAVHNNMDRMLDCVVLTDPLDAGFYHEIESVSSGDAASRSLTYTVTEFDATIGSVMNYAYAVAYVDGTPHSMISNAVTEPCGFPAGDGPFGVISGIEVILAEESTPANGSYYVEGENFKYSITCTNVGELPLTDARILDALQNGSQVANYTTLQPGESKVVYQTYVVTAADADNGMIFGQAYGMAFANGNLCTDVSDLFVSAGGASHDLEVVLAEESLPLNGSYYRKGETLAYTITYTNVSENLLTDVVVKDMLQNMAEVGYAEMLNPGESRVIHLTYPVTDSNIAAGYIIDQALGQYYVNGTLGSDGSNVLIVLTDGEPGPIPGGSVDIGKLSTGLDCCSHSLVARDNASSTWETDFCSAHTPIQLTVMALNQTASTPDMHLQVATQAAALWRAEVDNLYRTLHAAADPLACTNVMMEYARFMADMASYEAMLNLLHPGQPVLVAQKMAAIWEDKCVALCGEVHADASGRKDSLLAVTPTAGAAAFKCTRVTAAEENGRKTFTQHYCPAHVVPFATMDVFLHGQDTAAGWTAIRSIWEVELNKTYKNLCPLLGDNSALAMAEYGAFTQWLQAREAELTVLYPDNPEVVAQIMVKHIMNRVNDLCRITQ